SGNALVGETSAAHGVCNGPVAMRHSSAAFAGRETRSVIASTRKKTKRIASVLEIFRHRFGSGADMELLIDAANIAAHGMNAHTQIIRNLLVELAGGHRLEHLAPPV